MDANEFFRTASWQCVRTSNSGAVARALALGHSQPARLPDDLVEIDDEGLTCVIVVSSGWTYVFGRDRGLRSARRLSSEFGECLSLHIDEPRGTYRCERASRGRVLRRVYASLRDREYDSEGEPGPGEPLVPWLDRDGDGVPELGLASADVLRFAQAWGSDPYVAFSGHARAFVASRRPAVTAEIALAQPPPTRGVAAVWALVVLLVLGGMGATLWWLSRPDRQTAAGFCEQHPLCSTCVGCAASPPHACAEVFQTCEDDPHCSELIRCLADCTDLVTRMGFTAPSVRAKPCFDTCRSDHSEGLQAYCGWADCAYRQACAQQCDDPGFLELSACPEGG